MGMNLRESIAVICLSPTIAQFEDQIVLQLMRSDHAEYRGEFSGSSRPNDR